MELGVEIELVLHEASEMRAEDTSLMSRGSRTVISDCGILARGDANTNDLG